MNLLWVVLFLVMYYIRPQEWFTMFAAIPFARLVMLGALVSLVTRARSFHPRELLRTPHDWTVLLFYVWMILASPNPFGTFKETYSLPITYFIIVQTLDSTTRIKHFLGWWTFLIVAIATLAVLSEYGFDPLGSHELTHGRMKGRLSLNLSIFNNPNALGHNVVAAIPMLYFFSIWRRPLFLKEIGYVCLVLPLYCIYLTASKGAFITGGLTTLATLTFGRPKVVQAVIVAAAIAGGGTILYSLPRMNELKQAKTDEAILGRVAAFQHGLQMFEEKTKGIGYRQWLKSFHATHGYNKSAHSSYVQLAAELGYVGLLLFLGILYCNLRTLITAHTVNDDEERIRRILFVLVFSYMVSSWMVDFGYRPTFFMFTAAIAALHRQLHVTHRRDEEGQAAAPAEVITTSPWRARLVPMPRAEESPENAPFQAGVVTPAPGREPIHAESPSRIGWGWNRLGWLDLALIVLFTEATVKFWRLILTRL